MPRIKPPIWNRTFDLIKRLAELYTYGSIASWCGVETQTAEAWGREPESDENPSGTGKRNTFDCTKRLIGKAFVKDPALAREMANVFPAYVDSLEEADGREFIARGGNLIEKLAHSSKEHADILVKAVSEDADLDEIYEEYLQADTALRQFGTALNAAKSQAELKARRQR